VLEGVDHLECVLLGIADDVLLVVIVRKRYGRLSDGKGDGARILDLLQRAVNGSSAAAEVMKTVSTIAAATTCVNNIVIRCVLRR